MDTSARPFDPPDADSAERDLLDALRRAAETGDLPEDPELAALAAAYRGVYAATQPLVDAPPACSLTIDDIDAAIRADARPLLLRPWALRAAAALLVVAAGVAGVKAWSGAPVAPVVHLTHMAEVAGVASDPLADAAERAAPLLADFTAVEGDEMRWIESLDAGRDVARVSGRPILLFIHHPTCPWCLTLRRETFRDADVAARMREFVPVRVSVLDLPEELQPLLERGWPYLGALDADGNEVLAFAGPSKADQLTESLQAAIEKTGVASAPAWGPLRARAARLNAAASAVDAGRLHSAVEQLSSLATEDPDGAFGGAARQMRDTLGADARRSLAAAQSAAHPAEELDGALVRFEGTPWADDIRAVREALRTSGLFPRLEPPLTEKQPPLTEKH